LEGINGEWDVEGEKGNEDVELDGEWEVDIMEEEWDVEGLG
jgi:hypothetical protein